MRLLISIVLAVVSLSVYAQSEHYNFSKLDTYTGLSHNQVNAILKDPRGFIWFGTMSGLNRYDGYSFKVYRNKHNDSTSLYDNCILSLYELPDEKMWVETRNGPCIYNSKTDKFIAGYNNYLQALGLPSGIIINIVKGHNGRYWFLYDNLELYLYSVPEKKAMPFRQKLNINPTDKISSLKETRDGRLWFVCRNGLLQGYDLSSGKTIFSGFPIRQLTKGENVNGLFTDSDGDVWVWAYGHGAFLFNAENGQVKAFNESSGLCRLSSNLVSQIVQDDKGLIWVSTDHGGVTLIDKANEFRASYLMNNPKDLKSLSQNSITALYKDDKGIVWLGTYKKGVNYFNGNIVQFPFYRNQESNVKSLPFDDVNRFVEDKWGNIWIGTNGGGLIYFNRQNNTFKQYLHDPGNKKSLSNNVIVSLCIDHQGLLWIGTYFGGLNSFDGREFRHYRHNDQDSSSLANDNVWEIFEDREHNLWIGTLGGGLNLFDRKTNRFQQYPIIGGKPPYPSRYITAILQDRKGNLWIGAENGVAVIENGTNKPAFYHQTNDTNGLSSSNVICLLEDSQGNIWVGTREGLNRFNEQTKSFQAFTTSDGLPDNLILNILEDDNRTLWLSTPGGLCNLIPKQNGNRTAYSVICYDEMNNVQNHEFNDNAALKTKAGELIFGGPSGFNIIDPDKIKMPPDHPEIVFTGLQILNKDIEPGELINDRVLLPQSLPNLESINLKYKENVFSIEFASLDFGHGAREKYAYMLEGFNADWLYASGNQRRATYTNLGPGRYTFKVKVLGRNGSWSDVNTLRINIEPPFWLTPLAFIVYALCAAGFLLLWRKIALDRMRMRFEVRQQRMEAERAHALEQLKTKFFTNVSHEFRTPLSLIISPLDKIIDRAADEEQKKQLNLVQRNAKRLLNLVNQLLDFRKMEVQEIKLHPSIGDIILFIRDINQSFLDIAEKKKIRFSFSTNIESLEIYFDKDKIEKILFNLLSNAFKYTHDNGMVSLNLVYNPAENGEGDGILVIEVKDTGIGIPADQQEKIFERFFQTDVPESMVNQGTGIGLAITKEFVRLHNGIITVKSEPEKGTCFSVMLPARKIYRPINRTATIPTVEEEGKQIIPEESPKNGKRKTILIVEDNEDLRFYLKDNLKGQYHIEEATNGKEGWEKTKQLYPDLVVSDIMMPLMDGVELARKIKTETLTAHIPVILLTAMGSEEKQLEGLKAGVNDYITKPFTFDILASRIRNLLAQQQLLQKKFHKQIEVNPAEITVTSVDEKFLKQALTVVEKNMDNPGFSVEDFSTNMHMDRSTLYRKILSLTGKTPIEFIRSIRLKRAAQLLLKSGMSIAEVAYEVGFNNPKNFTKTFKEEFKVTPSQFIASKKEEDV
ncbi:hybrid sensor histidine kinase/response regulator transcription factor [Longitalea arenae]|uniref:hybrid sensor histidine kinase/response regulator transcription factor n=1 Tax=Longitalea arenae TaxID=2812558 RepID=UPI001966DC7E|nr:hybrid sensor histidine kinase/response regulator transcription factor [Longitalea arenae]